MVLQSPNKIASFYVLRRWKTIGWTVLAAALTLGLAEGARFLIDLPIVTRAILRLAWWLTPWRHLPTVLVEQSVLPSRFLTDSSPGYLLAIADTAVFVLVGMVLLQAITFTIVGGVYRLWGWPRYGRDARWSDVYWTGLARFAWRAVWVYAGVEVVRTVFFKLGWCLVYAGYSLLPGYAYVNNDHFPYWELSLLAVTVLYAWIAARVVRTEVAVAIGSQRRRCRVCGYLLRGLVSPRCPECGEAFDTHAPAPIALGRPGRVRWALQKIIVVGLLALTLLAPVGVAFVVFSLPREWQRQLPPSLASSANEIEAALDRFPLPLGMQWVVRDKEALALIRAKPYGEYDWICEATYWSHGSRALSEPPDQTISRKILIGGLVGEYLAVGPWVLGVSEGSFRSIYLTRPNQTYSVEVVDVDSYLIDFTPAPTDTPGGVP